MQAFFKKLAEYFKLFLAFMVGRESERIAISHEEKVEQYKQKIRAADTQDKIRKKYDAMRTAAPDSWDKLRKDVEDKM